MIVKYVWQSNNTIRRTWYIGRDLEVNIEEREG